MKTTQEMAREAGLQEHIVFSKALEAFAELVRADERNRTWTQEHWTEIIQSYLEKDNLQLAQKKPQNCGTGYCSCIECVMKKKRAKMINCQNCQKISCAKQVAKQKTIVLFCSAYKARGQA